MDPGKEFLTLEMYYKAIEGSDSGLWVCDVQKGICYLSTRYYTMLGYEPLEFEGTMANLFSLLHPDDVDKTNKLFNDFYEGKVDVYRNEVRLKNKSGTYSHILTQGLGERDENGKVKKFIGWNIDISSLKETQKKLDEERSQNIAQSRLAQFGLFAGGLAHEVNNPLTTIQGRSEMILKSLRSGKSINTEALIAGIEEIHSASKRIASIVKGLRSIAYVGESGDTEKISLIYVVEEVLSLAQAEIKSRGIKIHVQFPNERPIIQAKTALLCQVFLNLINNASDALDTKSEKDIWIKIESNDNDAFFIIEDNGSGIKPEDHDKIMLPFFTTKAPGKGTGLGLSISKSIMQSQKGDIQYKASQGISRFEVRIPLLKS